MIHKSYFRLEDIYNITGIGIVLVGKVESGTLTKDMQLNITGYVFKIELLETNNEEITRAEPGTGVGISIGFVNSVNERLDKFKTKIITFSDSKHVDSTNSSELEQVTSLVDNT